MNCESVRLHLSSYVDGELDDSLHEQVERHLKSCEPCARALERLARLVARTDEVTTEVAAPAEFTGAVMAKVRTPSLSARMKMPVSLLRERRLSVAMGAVVVLIILAVNYHTRMMNPEFSVSPLQTILVAPASFAWGSTGAARILTKHHQTNEPLPQTQVRLIATTSAGREFSLWRGVTNARGIAEARFDLPKSLEGACQLVALAEDDRVVRDLVIERQAKVLLTTDKPLYQPGQTVHLRTLSLLRPGLAPAAGASVTIEIEDAKQNKVFKQEMTASEWGIAAVKFPLADEVNLGAYKVKATLEWRRGDAGTGRHGDAAKNGDDIIGAERTFNVQRYVLPKFKVEAKLDRTYYLPKQTVHGAVNARYFFGKPVARGQVIVKLSAFDFAFHQFASIKGTTNAEGLYEFESQLPDYFVGQPLEQGNALLRCEVSVRDTANHEESSTATSPVAAQPIRVTLVPEGGKLIPKVENTVYVVTSYPDGSPAKTDFTVVQARDNQVLIDESTDALGIGEFHVTPAGAMRFTVQARDARGNEAKASLTLTANAATTDAILLRADKAIYKVGDSTRLSMLSSQKSGAVFVDAVRDGQTLVTTTVELKDGKGLATFDLSSDFFGAVTFHAYTDIDPFTPALSPESGQRGNIGIPGANAPRGGGWRPGALAVRRGERGGGMGGMGGGIMGGMGGNPAESETLSPDSGEATGVRGLSRATRTIIVERADELQVKVTPDNETHRPGEEAKIEFAVSDTHGEPTAAAIGLDIVDESVFALHEREAGLEKWYFAIEKEILKPRAIAYKLPNSLNLPSLLSRTAEPPSNRTTDSRQRATQVLLCSLPARGDAMKVSVGSDYETRLAQARRWKWEYERQLADLQPSALLFLGFALTLGACWSITRKSRRLGVSLSAVATVILILTSLSMTGTKVRSTYVEVNKGLSSTDGVFAFMDAAKDMREHGAPAAPPPMAFEVFDRKGGLARAVRGTVFADGHVSQLHGFSLSTGWEPSSEPPPVRLRQFFPETLMSEPALITDERGRATLTVPMADSITTWRLTGLASSQRGQLGSVAGALRVFQDFFVDIDFPVALTQGDEVSVPIVVYNYLPEKQTVNLNIEKGDWFDSLSQNPEAIALNPNEVRAIHFPLRATRIGRHGLTVRAASDKSGKGFPSYSDAIRREVEVFPNGREVVVTASGRLEGTVTKTVMIPDHAIPDASKLLVKIYPGVFSQTVEGLESMLSVPHG